LRRKLSSYSASVRSNKTFSETQGPREDRVENPGVNRTPSALPETPCRMRLARYALPDTPCQMPDDKLCGADPLSPNSYSLINLLRPALVFSWRVRLVSIFKNPITVMHNAMFFCMHDQDA
jgi:hypothetical protein